MTPAEERAHNRRRAARVWLDRIPDSGGWDRHARYASRNASAIGTHGSPAAAAVSAEMEAGRSSHRA